MIEHDVGVSGAQRYDIKKVDLDYFADETGALPIPAPAGTGQ
jgi:hypothetical protein